jgi:hypothetical protein
MMYGSIFTDHIVCANSGPWQRKSFQRLQAGILRGMVNDDKIWFTDTIVGCTYPIWRLFDGIIYRVPPALLKSICIFF